MTTLETLPPKPAVRPAPEAKPPSISRHVGDDQVCVLTFDRPNSSANVFNKATLDELDNQLDFITADDQIKGVVLTSSKPSIFIAGADIKAVASSDQRDLREFIELGQSVFNRLANLRIPTVAAVHGACVGGGYEVSLACDYRIASPDRATKIGLPEIQLGILPAWGGSTRLPRLVGLPRALDIILAGKTIAAKQALKYGMVDEVAPREYLVEVARKRILSGDIQKLHRKKFALTNNSVVAKIIARKAKSTLLAKTRGHYPAPLKALEVVTRGLPKSVEQSLALESVAVEQLAQTDACRNLIRIFLMQEKAKKLSSGSEEEKSAAVKKIAVIGAGVMGAGIAQWASARGMEVIMRDINAEQVAKGMASMAKLYQDGARRHAFTAVEARAGMDRIHPAPGEVPLVGTEIVIEAAVERMDLKKQIFSRLDATAPANTILATNTSALSISELAEATSRPERIVGIHFFNPVHRMQLVEVVVGKRTDAEVVRRSVRFVQQLGKLPVVVKDSPGFLVNRILMPYLIEAGRLFENGARVEDIDKAMLEFGTPMGPLRLIDEVGVDVAQHVADTLAKAFAPRLETPALLARMLEAKLLGRKGGRGFYLYARKGKEQVNAEVDKLRKTSGCARLTQQDLCTRMSLLMINEAARCLEEEIVVSAEDVDFGMIMGTGFAPFRGGPLRYADSLGIKAVVDQMKRLVQAGEGRFAPCALLQQMADQDRTFYP